MAFNIDWFDGHDHWQGTSESVIFWDGSSSASTTAIGLGRYSDPTWSRSLDITGSVVKTGLTPSAWNIVGFSFKEVIAAGARNILVAEDGFGDDALTFRIAGGGGAATVHPGGSGVTAIATLPGFCATGEWVNTILAWNSNETVGELHVYKNGALITSVYSAKTVPTGVGNPEQLRWAGQNVYIDDTWRAHGSPDASVTADAAGFGDLFVWTGFANADGNYTDFTYAGAGVTANYQAVDEHDCDQDTSFNQSSTIGARDSFSFDPVPTDIVDTNNIFAVRVVAAARYTDSGPHTVNVFTRYPVSGTPADYDATGKLISSTYRDPAAIWETHPDTTTGAWTAAIIDDSEFGYRNEA